MFNSVFFFFGFFFLVGQWVFMIEKCLEDVASMNAKPRSLPTAVRGATTVASVAATAPAAMMASPIFLVLEVSTLGTSSLGGSGSTRVDVLVEACVVRVLLSSGDLAAAYRGRPRGAEARIATASAVRTREVNAVLTVPLAKAALRWSATGWR